jgi:hypothetical protein
MNANVLPGDVVRIVETGEIGRVIGFYRRIPEIVLVAVGTRAPAVELELAQVALLPRRLTNGETRLAT